MSETGSRFARGCRLAAAVMVLAGGTTRPAVAQNGATFEGTVHDTSGGVLPGATVTATRVATGTSQAATTDEQGRYRIPLLPVGEYRVEAMLQGFQAQVRTGIVLTVGLTQVVDFTLTVGQIETSVTVAGGAQLVDTASSSVSSLVNATEMRNLPLNGRSFDQLITLSAGTVAFTQRATNAFRGTANQYSAAGMRPGTTKLVVDGAELAGAGGTHTNVASASGNLLGVEAIQEFAVLTNNGDASFGKKPGGQVNIVTRSGTNEVHGAAFEFYRNDALNARNFFDAGKSSLRQNSYGAAIGGPIAPSKAFFFSNVEKYKERRGVPLVAVVPSVAVRQGIFPDGTVIPVNPLAKPILDLYPVPNGRDFGDGTAEATTPATRRVDDTYIVGRVDGTFSSSTSLFGRYLIQTGERFEPNDNGIGQFLEDNPIRTQLFTTGLKTILSARLLNQATVAFNRGHFSIDFVPREGISIAPELILVQGQGKQGGIGVGVSGGASVTQLPVLGGNSTVGSANNYVNRQVFQISDQINYTAGAHFVQVGGDLQRIMSNDFLGTRERGFLNFPSLQALVQGRPNQIRGPLQGSNSHFGWRQVYVAAYAQDRFKARPNLTVNLGLRWELMSNPIEAGGRTSAFVPVGGVLPNSATLTDHVFAKNNSGNFAPRIGFAWDPFGAGHTSVRAGGGLFYNQIENEFRYALATGPPFWNNVILPNPPFPNPGQLLATTSVAPTGTLTVAGIEQAPQIPSSVQYNVRVEQAVAPSTIVAVTYAGSRGAHLFRTSNPQIPAPVRNDAGRWAVPQQLLNPALNAAAVFGSYDAQSVYNSLQVELDRRLSGGLRFKASFTWAKAIDEGTEYIQAPGGVASQSSVLANHAFDRGLASFDVRRRFVSDWTYDLPVSGHHGAAALLDNWTITGILQAQDGFPFTVLDGVARSFIPGGASQAFDRPDLAPGHTGPIILGGPDRYFDPTAFQLQPVGVLGNVGNTSLIGPGLFTLDASLIRAVQVRGSSRLQFRVDVFNLTNRANFGLPDINLFQPNGQLRGAAGRIQATSTTSREFQLSVKLVF